MDGYLIDTQTISYWFDEKSTEHNAVQAAAETRRGKMPLYVSVPLYVSAITVGEIAYGHAVNPAGAGPQREAFLEFVRARLNPHRLEVSRHTAEPYGQLRAALFEKFAPNWKKRRPERPEELCDPATGRELGIQENDLWIVAQAAERNVVLVTHDKLVHIREALTDVGFRVRIEDWASET